MLNKYLIHCLLVLCRLQNALSSQVLTKGRAGVQPKYERASPKSRDLVIGTSDLEDVDFVVFDQAPSLLTGTVSVGGGGEWRKHVTVEVVDANNRGTVVRSSPLPASRFFEFKDLPAGRYLVRLASGLPEKTFAFAGDEAEADLRAERTVHVGNLKFQVKKQRGAQVSVAHITLSAPRPSTVKYCTGHHSTVQYSTRVL